MAQLSSVKFPPKHAGLIIADDHQLFNDGLQTMLEAEPDLTILSRVYNGNDVAHAIQTYKPDLLLLDINMPGKDGLTLALEFKHNFPELKIILLSMYSDKQFITLAREAGVNGYLLKTTCRAELLIAIRKVLSGLSCYYNDNDTANRHCDDLFMQKYKLTPREREIIGLIRAGLSNQEIAEKIFLSLFTVETHRRNINLKLGVKKPAELILKAIEIGL